MHRGVRTRETTVHSNKFKIYFIRTAPVLLAPEGARDPDLERRLAVTYASGSQLGPSTSLPSPAPIRFSPNSP